VVTEQFRLFRDDRLAGLGVLCYPTAGLPHARREFPRNWELPISGLTSTLSGVVQAATDPVAGALEAIVNSVTEPALGTHRPFIHSSTVEHIEPGSG
jgi:hypothetical protein